MNSNDFEGVENDVIDIGLIQAVVGFAENRVCEKGAELINTGEQANCFYYVEKGKFEVSYSTNNTSIVVALIGSGSIFGEIGFFDHMTRTRNIHAVEASEIRVFDQSAMKALYNHDLGLYADFMEYLLRSVCFRFRQILTDRGPLSAYAASLSTGKEQFQGVQSLPADLLASTGWRTVSRQLEDFKAALFDISYQLQKDEEPTISPDLIKDGQAALDALALQVRQFDKDIAKEHAPLMWGYVFKELFPYFMRSRFAERVYYKPKGYAGDYKMIEQIYQNQPDGDGKLGRMIDGWLLNRIPSQAVRNRRILLRDLLDRLCRERLSGDRPVNIMNLASGLSRELFDLLAVCEYSSQIDALCIDIDSEALQYAAQNIYGDTDQASIRFMCENVIKWALGRARHDIDLQDIIYSSGLCDYLDNRLMLRLIDRCYHQLKEGGALVFGNFTPVNPDRPIMDNILYWRLIHRDEAQMRQLFADSAFRENVEILTEEEGVNLFAIAIKL